MPTTMRVLTSLEELDPAAPLHAGCVTIGNFDGVHRGHQALLGAVLERARAEGGPAVVITFEPHPATFFDRRRERSPFLLTTLRQKLRAFEQAGIDLALVLPFDEALASMEAEAFVRDVLVERMRPRHVLVGYDFRFGKGRAGDLAMLQRIGASHGFDASAFGVLLDELKPVSSSRVRQAVVEGAMEEATHLLARPFALDGTVVSGDARGRTIGFPTANLEPDPEQLEPEDGIYVSTLVVDGLGELASVSSIGVRPTYYEDVETAPRTLETYVLDAPDGLELYGRRVELQLHRRLRPELRFDGTEALVAQIERDVAEARAWHGLGD